jgi:quercetin dioxygenase-like cupin family protein
VTTYRPSPRPTFAVPSLIRRTDVTRHIWGEPEAGEVADWIYASTGMIHCLVFGLPPGGAFRHSPEFRTVFGADELLYVLEGTMVIANPETGEVHRIEQGRSVRFGPSTWHHAFAHGSTALRVIEFFAPPPSTGSSGAYARTRPYVSESRYARAPGDDRVTMHPVSDADVVWRRDLDVLVGVHHGTDQLTAGVLEVNAGETSRVHAHPGDELLFVLDGVLHVRAWHGEETYVFELGPEDACYLPAGARHEYRVYGSTTARALFGVAPTWE